MKCEDVSDNGEVADGVGNDKLTEKAVEPHGLAHVAFNKATCNIEAECA